MQSSTMLRMRQSSYLSVSRFSLIEALQDTLPMCEVENWRAFAESMAFVIGCSYATVMEGMKRYAWQESAHRGQDDESLASLFSYISRLLSLLSAAQYNPMSHAQWHFGVESQNYTSQQTVHHHIDKNPPIFKEYWNTHSYWFGENLTEATLRDEPRPEFSDRVLLFYRGMSEIKHTGYHIPSKITYLLTLLVAAAYAVVDFFKPNTPAAAKDGGADDAQRGSGEFGFGVGDAGHASFAHSRFGAKKLRRVTLESYIKQHGLLRSLFSRITLIEPAFNSVILVYPAKDYKHPKQKPHEDEEGQAIDRASMLGGGAVGLARLGLGQRVPPRDHQGLPGSPPASPTTQGARATVDRSFGNASAALFGSIDTREQSELSSIIQIESYRRVPFRDLGLLIPGRKVALGLVNKFRVLCEIGVSVLLIIACISCLTFAQPTSTFLAIEHVLVVLFLLVLIVSVLNTTQSLSEMKMRLESKLQDWLDQRLVGKGNTFITSLVSQVQEQELKEVLLGYFLLWTKSPMTQRQLDYEAETFLNDRFRLEIDFEVEDALQKLILLALVEEIGGKFRCAQTPRDYLDDPVPRWLPFVHSFDFDEKEREAEEDSAHDSPAPGNVLESIALAPAGDLVMAAPHGEGVALRVPSSLAPARPVNNFGSLDDTISTTMSGTLYNSMYASKTNGSMRRR